MTLFINGNNLNNPFWGVSRVAFELVRALDGILADPAMMAPFGEAVLLGRQPDSPMPGLTAIRYEHVAAPNLYWWEHVSLAWRTRGHPIVGFQNRNSIFKRDCATMIHGLQVLTQPASYSARARWEGRLLLPLIGRMHRTILTVSAFSADEIAAHGIAPRDRVAVVYNGIDHREVRTAGLDDGPTTPGLRPRRYVVAQSSTKAHKNIALLLAAFADPALADLTLVLFGGDGRAAFDAAGLAVPPNVVFAGMIGDAALHALLSDALCLAFPSLTEGFGLPPLEAMALGTPAVVSDRGAIPEVCGTAAMVLDAHSVADWVAGVARLRDDVALWQDHAARGREQARAFTWARAGQSLYDILLARHAPRAAPAGKRQPRQTATKQRAIT